MVHLVAGTNNTRAAIQQLFAMQHGLVHELHYMMLGTVFNEFIQMLNAMTNAERWIAL